MREISSKFPDIKMIAISSGVCSEKIANIKQYGFDAYVTKPLHRDMVYRTLLHLCDEKQKNEPVVENTASNCFKSQRILVVDDNAMNLALASKIFKKMGHGTDVVNSGALAIKRLSEENYNVIFMDMQMPEMSGVEATRIIREQGVVTPIIALTANAFESDKQSCLEAGMDDFTTKPLRRLDLQRLIEQYT